MKVTHAFLLVEDQDRAKDVHTRILGFTVETDYQGEEFRWLSLQAPDGGAELVLDRADEAGSAFLKARFEARVPACSFTLSGLEEFEKIRERGATVIAEPARQEYGGTDALIDDGCGNIVCLHCD